MNFSESVLHLDILDKSNVGLDSEADKAETKSASDIALEALVQCELNGVSKAKFLSALKEQLEMLDESTDKSVMQAVA